MRPDVEAGVPDGQGDHSDDEAPFGARHPDSGREGGRGGGVSRRERRARRRVVEVSMPKTAQFRPRSTDSRLRHEIRQGRGGDQSERSATGGGSPVGSCEGDTQDDGRPEGAPVGVGGEGEQARIHCRGHRGVVDAVPDGLIDDADGGGKKSPAGPTGRGRQGEAFGGCCATKSLSRRNATAPERVAILAVASILVRMRSHGVE